MSTVTAPKATLLLTREQPDRVARLDRSKELRRVRPGVYVRTEEWAALAPWDRYELRVEAVQRTWTNPIFCFESAARSHGLPEFDEPRFIHLFNPGGTSWREGDVIVHGAKGGRSTTTVDGRTVTSADETAIDLCRVLPPAFALAVADTALRMLRASDKTLGFGALGRQQADRRGRRQLDWLDDFADARAESVGESVSRAVIRWLGYADPDLQVEFEYEGCLDRADFYWRGVRTIGESDGYGKYDADNAAKMKQHFVNEKKREDRLRRYEKGFIRWDWPDTMRHAALDKKLKLGGIPRVRPRNVAMLATLAQNPRSFTREQLRQRDKAESDRRNRRRHAERGDSR
jgi:hypothetical protein